MSRPPARRLSAPVAMLTRLVLAALIALVASPLSSALAHQNHDHKSYVSPKGVDQGDCATPQRPCRTITYALTKVPGKGNEVRVAAGEYFFDAQEVLSLVGETVLVTGGWTMGDLFGAQDVKANPTYIAGIPARYRERLLARGFVRIEDRDGIEDETDIAPGANEPIIYTELETPSARQNCVNGMAGIFACEGIDFMGSVALSQFVNGSGTAATSGSNLWGHVDLNTNREYAVIGVNNGTGVVDVTDPVNPVLIGTVTGPTSQWREVKVYQYRDEAANRWKAYAYISTEAGANVGLQIIDLNRLSDPTPSVSLAATIGSDFTRSHTVYIKNVDYATNVALPGTTPVLYMNGTNLNTGTFRAFSLANPTAPALIGAPATNLIYTHDSTSMRITDSRTSQCAPNHNPCDLMFAFSSGGGQYRMDIWDVTDPATPVRLSATPYEGSRYSHSGWFSDDKMYLFHHDELDEQGLGHNTKVRTFDISNLLAPTISGTWIGGVPAIDHNGYTLGDKYYMSHYRRGITIFDVSNPNVIDDVAFLDTYPGSDSAQFSGAWGVYPYLPSGTIIVSDLQRGLIIAKESAPEAISNLQAFSSSPTRLSATTSLSATIGAGTDVAYQWDFGDGSPAVSGAQVTHTYAQPGTYTAEVLAVNDLGSATATTTVRVIRGVNGLTVASNSPILLPATAALSATLAAGDDPVYSWNFGDGSPVTVGGTTVTHAYAQRGTYTVQVTASNSVSSLTASTTITVRALGYTWLPLVTAQMTTAISAQARSAVPVHRTGGSR